MNKGNEYMERAAYIWSADSIRMILTPSQTARSTFFYLQEIGDFKTEFPYFTERKNLNSFLILYTISGRGTLTYEDHTYLLTPGVCFYINCMKHHEYKTKSGDSWEFLWMHFNGPNALGYYEEYVKNGFSVHPAADPFFMESTMRRLIAVNQKRDAATELLSSSLIVNILTELLIDRVQPVTNEPLLPGWIKTLMKDIEKEFKNDLSLDQLAHKHGLNKFYLSREFKKYIGTTVNEYIILTRISYAKELLKYSDHSVEEITYEIGMHNTSHFINLFKAREGVTPLAFRKEWKG